MDPVYYYFIRIFIFILYILSSTFIFLSLQCFFLQHNTNSSTGYAIEPRLKQIQDEDVGHIFREATSASSISDSVNRINKNQYNYRDEVSEYEIMFITHLQINIKRNEI